MDDPKFVDAITGYLDAIHEKISDSYEVGYTKGQRYARVMISDIRQVPSRTDLHSFVDMNNGDIFRPLSWKAPAKHSRGNIYDLNPKLIGRTGPLQER